MGKKIGFFISIVCFMMLAACSSAEEDEILDYHNSFIDNVKPKVEEIEGFIDESSVAEDDEGAYEIIHEEVLPLAKEIKEYVNDQDPEEEATQEYHELRLAWADKYYESMQKMDEVLEASAEGSTQEAEELQQEFEELGDEAIERATDAEDKINELKDEYGFEEDEND